MDDLTGGDCYIAAASLIVNRLDDDMLLCHGTVTGQGPLEGVEFTHAWVEMGDVCIDKSNGGNFIAHRDEYYALGNVRDVSRYTPSQARKMMLKYEHYGPW